MKRTKQLRTILCLVLAILLAAAVCSFSGCTSKNDNTNTAATTEAPGTSAPVISAPDTSAPDTSAPDATTLTEVIGEGETKITFTVRFKDGSEKEYEVHTNSTTVGDALQELGLIDGEEGEYGLYVKTVAGETLDWDTDGMYWAFYINDEYSMTSVDSTNVEAGTVYSFRAE